MDMFNLKHTSKFTIYLDHVLGKPGHGSGVRCFTLAGAHPQPQDGKNGRLYTPGLAVL